MNTEKFNLVDEDWIPVLMKDGKNRRVSLRDVFVQGEDIADLSLVAYERVAVMRFLICVAMAAFEEGALKDEKDWREAKGKMCSTVDRYLDKWHERFNFFGQHAFMQPDGLTATKPSQLEKLFPHRASGNNGTLFDHAILSSNKNISVEDWPIGMLTYLNYSAGGRHAQCVWSGKLTDGSVTAGPCREKSMVQTYLVGDTLKESVWLNLVTDQMVAMLPSALRGHPFWECESLQRNCIKPPYGANTLLGRLVPLSRVMKFEFGSEELPLGEGLKYAALPEARETMAAVYAKEDTKNNATVATYVSVSSEEMPWRNLQAILSLSNQYGVLTLRHLHSLAENNSQNIVTLWCGGLVADQAKDIAVGEWRSAFRVGTIDDYHLKIYQEGVDFAKEVANKRVFGAAKSYCKAMMMDKVEVITQPVRRLFWEMLNKQQPILQALAFEEKGSMTDWRKMVGETARQAFTQVCPQTTGRQLTAFVNGLSKLNFKKEN